MTEEKKQEKKPFYKQRRFRLIIFIIICGLFSDPKKSDSWTKEPKLTIKDVVQERIDYLNSQYWPEGTEPRAEFDSMVCRDDCENAYVDFNLKSEPKDLTADTIARWQAVNLSKLINEKIWDKIVLLTIKVAWKPIETCKATKGAIHTTYWENGCLKAK